MKELVRISLTWLVGLLNANRISYQVTGGLAAHLYGSERDIYDIDIEVRSSDLVYLERLFRDYVKVGLSRYIDDNFNLDLMTLDYHGQLIDISGVDGMYIKGEYQIIDLSDACRMDVDGLKLNVVCKDNLISYKKLLGRDEDLVDISFLDKKISA